jgi:hypothetical protein
MNMRKEQKTMTKIKRMLGLKVPKEEIKRHDVLLGRSQLSARHTGNIAFRALIDSRLRLYSEATTKSSKTHIVVMVTNCVYESGGRFLFLEDQSLGLWAEVDRRYAREKVGNSLRDGVKVVNSGKKRASSGYDAAYCEAAHFASIVLGVAHTINSDKGGMYSQFRHTAATKEAKVATLSPGPVASSKVPSKEKFQPHRTSLPMATVTVPDNKAAYILLGVLKKATDEDTNYEDDVNEALTLGKIQELKDFDDDASFEDWKDEHEADIEASKDFRSS